MNSFYLFSDSTTRLVTTKWLSTSNGVCMTNASTTYSRDDDVGLSATDRQAVTVVTGSSRYLKELAFHHLGKSRSCLTDAKSGGQLGRYSLETDSASSPAPQTSGGVYVVKLVEFFSNQLSRSIPKNRFELFSG
ncbi:hypothetical protein VTO42DRAFT_647 [Malbranchea cinnamomea]